MKKFKTIIFTAILLSFGTISYAESQIHSDTGKLPSSTPTVIDDFEDGNYWIYASDDWDNWGGHKWSVGADLSKKWKSNGKYSLDCQMEKSTYGTNQAAVWYTEGEYDLSQFNYIVMDVYIPDSTCNFGLMLAIQSDDWTWCQAPQYHWLPKGEHTLVYDISSFSEKDRRTCVRFMIMHAMDNSQQGHFYLDNIRGYK